MPARVSVEIPATSANLGPGFDCLGLALELHNVFSLEIAESFCIDISGEGVDRLPQNENNLIFRSIRVFYEAVGKPIPPLHLTLENRIPLARGLGSSAAAVVGGLVAANAIAGNPLSQLEILRLATRIEGHPDNVAPALFGGLTVAVDTGDDVLCVQCPVPTGLKAVLFIPDFAMSTKAARRVLPRFLSRADAVFNISRTAALVAALTTNQLGYLREATRDHMHQPPREKIFPAMPALFAAALEAGALGAFLSGAGSTICALCTANESAVGQAMLAAGSSRGVSGRVQIASLAIRGAQVLDQ